MKFGKDLEQYKHPGWEDQYIDYKQLKDILKQLEEPDGPANKDDIDIEFFQALEDQLEKACTHTNSPAAAPRAPQCASPADNRARLSHRGR